jgi:hypothetical protein
LSGDLRDFTVPPRSPGRPPWRFTPGRFAAGVGAALLTHVPPGVLLLLRAGVADTAWLGHDAGDQPALLAGAFLLSLLVCAGGGAVAIARRESALGIGLVTGWVIGLIPAVVVFLSMRSAVSGA